LQSEGPTLTVYFDGSCPLCQAEIAHYRKQDGAGTICFLNVSENEQTLAPDLSKQQAMRRFHVRRIDGSLLSGAAAFVAIWSALPRWRWLARLAALPGILSCLEAAYRLFLPVRPTVSKCFGYAQTWYRARLKPVRLPQKGLS
jgi:predicted DCC family thiol-disulfide oxidoreductase YuxK